MSSSSDSSSASKHCVGDPMDKNTDVRSTPRHSWAALPH